MASEKKTRSGGLGRGLDAIFLDNAAEESGSNTLLRISDIEPRPDQPRKTFNQEALNQLADSIAANGLIQPIAVRPTAGGMYQIIAGERRWRAAKMAALSEIPAVIMDISDEKAAELALIENLQREDLNALEEAGAYRSLMEEFGYTQEEVARRVGRSRSAVANALRLFDLPQQLQTMVTEGQLSAGHARTLLGLKREEDMLRLANQILDRGMSVRALEEAVKALNARADREEQSEKPAEDEQTPPAIDYSALLAERVSGALGRRVKISDKNPKKPRTLTIEYTDNDDLESLLRLLCGSELFDDGPDEP